MDEQLVTRLRTMMNEDIETHIRTTFDNPSYVPEHFDANEWRDWLAGIMFCFRDAQVGTILQRCHYVAMMLRYGAAMIQGRDRSFEVADVSATPVAVIDRLTTLRVEAALRGCRCASPKKRRVPSERQKHGSMPCSNCNNR